MKAFIYGLLLIAFNNVSVSYAQTNNDIDKLITGTWKGTSLCQVKDSPCHDEMVVYHVTKTDISTYKFTMNKIVNGKEEEMGDLDFIYNKATHTLTCRAPGRVDPIWTFVVKGNEINGTLTIGGNHQLFRIIKVMKS